MKSSTVKYIFYGTILIVLIGLIYTNIAGKKQDEVFKQDYMQYQQVLQLLDSNQVEEGVAALEELIIKYPNEYTLYYNLALTYSDQGNFEKSAINYQKALNIRPALLQDRNFTFKMGESLYHIKEFEKAKTYLTMPVAEQFQSQKDELLQAIEKEIQS